MYHRKDLSLGRGESSSYVRMDVVEKETMEVDRKPTQTDF